MPLRDHPALHLTKSIVVTWLLELKEADYEDFMQQALKQRPLKISQCVPFENDDAALRAAANDQCQIVVKVEEVEEKEQKATAGCENEFASEGQEPISPGFEQKLSQIKARISQADAESELGLHNCVRPQMPTVQFSTPMYFGNESDGFVEIELMRVGPLYMIETTKATVQWATEDGAAKAGVKYIAATGKAEFEPGNAFTSFRVELINNDDWDPTLDFSIVLREDGIQNVELHRYHLRCRCKIIDDDAFPTNRFADDLLNDKEVNSSQLMHEYFKMNFFNSLTHRNSLKMLLADVLDNLVYMFCLVLKVLLLNELLMPVLEGERTWDSKRDTLVLMAVASCWIVPQHLMHIMNYRRLGWKVGGKSKKFLQANLMRKYMSFTPKALSDTDPGSVLLVFFKEIPELVMQGYMGSFKVVKDLAMLVMILLYQTVGCRLLELKTGEPQWIAVNCAIVFVFPVCMAVGLQLRSAKSRRLRARLQKEEHDFTAFTLDTLSNFFLLADYGQRGNAITKFEHEIDGFNDSNVAYSKCALNNEFIPKSLNHLITAIWIFYGGILVVNREIAMGTFLVNWSVFTRIGDMWASIYRCLLDIDAVTANLHHITHLMNLPTANHAEKDFGLTCNKRGRELATSLQLSQDDIPADAIPICCDNLAHNFTSSSAFRNVNFLMAQGNVHIIAGRRGTGKTTLLSLIGKRMIKQADSEGSLLVPAHLRVLHVSKEPLFFTGTLYDNLTYGVAKGDRDRDLARVVSICRGLDLKEKTIAMISDAPDAAVNRWAQILSRSDCTLLNLARGLVASPEVLCVHKPSMGLGPNTVPGVMGMLRKFVKERGVFQNVARYHFRRPRTCIFTFNTKGDEAYADEVHEIIPSQS